MITTTTVTTSRGRRCSGHRVQGRFLWNPLLLLLLLLAAPDVTRARASESWYVGERSAWKSPAASRRRRPRDNAPATRTAWWRHHVGTGRLDFAKWTRRARLLGTLCGHPPVRPGQGVARVWSAYTRGRDNRSRPQNRSRQTPCAWLCREAPDVFTPNGLRSVFLRSKPILETPASRDRRSRSP